MTDARVGTPVAAARLVGAGDLAGLTRHTRRPPMMLIIDLPRGSFVALPHPTPGETRLVIAGELGPATLAPFADALGFGLGCRPALVTLDLRHLGSIDARCAGVIAMASARVSGWGGALALHRPRAPVRRVLRLCRLAHLLDPPGGLEGAGT